VLLFDLVSNNFLLFVEKFIVKEQNDDAWIAFYAFANKYI